jgi:uncharacterized membrane protein
MSNFNGPVIDMTPDGTFVERPKPALGTILARVAIFGIALCVVAVLFWAAVFIIPVLIVLGIVGYFLARVQMRRFVR